MDNGKLWNYNLHYANYLLQEELPLSLRLKWLSSLHRKLETDSKGLEPYPVSLRLINAIRLIVKHDIKDKAILNNIKAEARFLSQRLEYHILGNHLLENAFALLLAGAFFGSRKWVNDAHRILAQELKEQVLKDGGHFELSPMYHQIILYRVLELTDWYPSWPEHNKEQLLFYRETAGKMLGWLKKMTFDNGDIPHFNDSADGIAYTSRQLFAYADYLQLNTTEAPLSDSGYRSIGTSRYECRVDVGPAGPSYQPGHAHADALSFILYVDKKPFLVEQGTSTYQIGSPRLEERGTAAHNTVVLNKSNQSQVWSGFRVGRRATVFLHNDSLKNITASHNGYRNEGWTHKRSFSFDEHKIIIEDQIDGKHNKTAESVARFHFHPDCSITIDGNKVIVGNTAHILLDKNTYINYEKYKFATGFNLHIEGTVLEVGFQQTLKTVINLIN